MLLLDLSIYLAIYSRRVCADGMEARLMAGPQGENAFGTDAMTGTNALPRGDNSGRPQSAPGGNSRHLKPNVSILALIIWPCL